ncbi:hypothetical protein [Streptomyces sp. NPDC005181]|uniref:hypothetical protein n=1 Tax=Streptomyces sp. NPDC005181 TaxID=3156869 RepID=UPI0033B8D326
MAESAGTPMERLRALDHLSPRDAEIRETAGGVVEVLREHKMLRALLLERPWDMESRVANQTMAAGLRYIVL